MMTPIILKDQKQEWTKSELERFAYLYYHKGKTFKEMTRYFELNKEQFLKIKDFVEENSDKYIKFGEERIQC